MAAEVGAAVAAPAVEIAQPVVAEAPVVATEAVSPAMQVADAAESVAMSGEMGAAIDKVAEADISPSESKTDTGGNFSSQDAKDTADSVEQFMKGDASTPSTSSDGEGGGSGIGNTKTASSEGDDSNGTPEGAKDTTVATSDKIDSTFQEGDAGDTANAAEDFLKNGDRPSASGEGGNGSGNETDTGVGAEDQNSSQGQEVQDSVDNAVSESDTEQANAEIAGIQEKFDRGEKLTIDEKKKLNESNKDPGKVRQEKLDKFTERVKNGETLTDSELEEWDKLENEAQGGEKSVEEQIQDLDKEMDELGERMMQQMMNGEEPSDEDKDRMQEISTKKGTLEATNDKELAREAVKRAKEKGAHGNREKLSSKSKDVQDKITELMSIEYQMMMLPKTVDNIMENKRKVMDEARASRDEAEKATGADRVKKKQVEYQAYLKVDAVNGQLAGVKYTAIRLNAHRADLEQDVRGKLGLSSGLGRVMEWGGAKAIGIATELAISIDSKIAIKY